ncbi:uncharacterized protein LOC144000900 [Festucalex cinctus]
MPGGKRADEIEEIKSSLKKLSGMVAELLEMKKSIEPLLQEIQQLKKETQEKDRHIVALEQKVDDLEQNLRINDVIVTGIKIKPRRGPLRAAASTSTEDSDQHSGNETVEQQVTLQLRDLGLTVDPAHIQMCFSLPTGGTRPPAVLIRFADRKKKIALLRDRHKLRGKHVYINENLTKRNADIAKKARLMRKNGLIESTWTKDCRIFIQTKDNSGQLKTRIVKGAEELAALERQQ